ncbi:MAG: hypothetical protein ACOCRK_11990 [bacterium]
MWNKMLTSRDKEDPIRLTDLTEPPCKECKNWDPRVVTDKYGNPDSVRCCTAPDMFFDFSCYTEKDDE